MLGNSGSIGTGNDNTAIGYQAAHDLTTGTDNTFVGSYAGDNVTSGSDNVYVGDNAGNTHATGIGCVYVGRANNCSASDVSQENVFGSSLTGKGNETTYIAGSNGTYNEANETHFDTTSDSRIKKNIVDYQIFTVEQISIII